MGSTESLTTVSYGATGGAVAGFQRSRTIARSVADTIARLRAAIEAADLWVLHEIDPQAVLRRGGLAILPAGQILFFHPRLMARLLSADPAALLEAPLKFAILELPDGTTAVRWTDPAAALGRYGHPALADLGRELAGLCEEIATAAIAEPETIDANHALGGEHHV